MRSVMKHTFSEVPRADIPRSTFDRSFGHKTTFDAGFLIPILVDEALPGDTFKVRMTAFARLATPIFPIMDNIFLDTFFFAVPNRLLWDNWERFNGAQDDPDDSTDFLVPVVTSPSGGWPATSLADYFGIPTLVDGISVNAFHFRAYNLIWNEWFRDQNLQDSQPVLTDNGPDAASNYNVLYRGKRHDYFTSALPWPQKGPGVTIPLGTTAPVSALNPNTAPTWHTSTTPGTPRALSMASGVSEVRWSAVPGDSQAALWDDPNLVADLSSATAATINSLRQAFQIQKIYERDARGGTRYIELVKSHFGVTSPDSRMQRPEFLGGGSTMVNISPIAQTSSTDGTSPQGNLAAMGTAGIHNHGFTMSFTEHCVIIGLVCARADLTYQQGINRMFSRQTRFDFYWPALSHIGEQAILNAEIYAQGAAGGAADGQPFGYQERYAEYRYKPSQVTGLFRSNHPQTLDSWHLSQEFSALPVLGETFIREDPPIDRVIAVNTEPHFLFDSYFRMSCARPMPVYGVPGLIDHF